MRYFDAHCDTITATADAGLDMMENDKHISFDKLKVFSQYSGIFAIWQDDSKTSAEALLGFWRYYDYWLGQLKKHKSSIVFCKNESDYLLALSQKRPAAFLAVEGGLVLDNDINNLTRLHEAGVRLMTLTWNRFNGICDGIGEPYGRGLSGFGGEVVAKMDELRMLIDVSHLSVQGFYDVMELSKGPVVASHSNSKQICPHIRNLSDEQFTLLIKSGGGAGINLYADFIADKRVVKVSDVIKHIDRFLSLGGENGLFIGADFDGMDRTVAELKDVLHMHILYEELLKHGYSERIVRKIFYDNLERIIRYSL